MNSTIKLRAFTDNVEEYTAGGAIMPGMLLLQTNATTVIAHNDDAPANCLPMFAIEDVFQGKGIDDAYALADKVRVWTPCRGDVVLGILENGADITAGDFLESNGAGYLQKFTSGAVVGQALETMDLSGSNGEEVADATLGYDQRIKVRIA